MFGNNAIANDPAQHLGADVLPVNLAAAFIPGNHYDRHRRPGEDSRHGHKAPAPVIKAAHAEST